MFNREGDGEDALRRIAWVAEEQVYGEVLSHGAFYSLVRFQRGGIEYEVMMENNEFTLLEDLIEYDDD